MFQNPCIDQMYILKKKTNKCIWVCELNFFYIVITDMFRPLMWSYFRVTRT